MSQDETALIPFPTHRTAQAADPLVALQAATTPIRTKIADLEHDYTPRDREFWEATLNLLAELRQALQPFLWALRRGTPILSLSPEQMHIKFTLMNPVYLLDERIDTLGIAMTSYLPRCKSYAHTRLQERHRLLMLLRELIETEEEIVEVVAKLTAERE